MKSKKRGAGRPPLYKKKLAVRTLRLPVDIVRAIELEARERDMKPSELMRHALFSWIANRSVNSWSECVALAALRDDAQ